MMARDLAGSRPASRYTVSVPTSPAAASTALRQLVWDRRYLDPERFGHLRAQLGPAVDPVPDAKPSGVGLPTNAAVGWASLFSYNTLVVRSAILKLRE